MLALKLYVILLPPPQPSVGLYHPALIISMTLSFTPPLPGII